MILNEKYKKSRQKLQKPYTELSQLRLEGKQPTTFRTTSEKVVSPSGTPPSRSRWQPRQDPCPLLPRPPLFPKRLQPLRLLQTQHQVPTTLTLQGANKRLLQLSIHQWMHFTYFREWVQTEKQLQKWR